jgi:hypothetical protein
VKPLDLERTSSRKGYECTSQAKRVSMLEDHAKNGS